MKMSGENEKEKVLKGAKISARSKLEGIRLMNELADRVLSLKQKLTRRKIREEH